MQRKTLRTKLYRRNGTFYLSWITVGSDKWQAKSLKTSDPDEARQQRSDFIDNHIPDESDQIAVLKAQIARLEGNKADVEAQTTLQLDMVWSAFLESTDRDPITPETLKGYVSLWQGEKTGLKKWMEDNGIANLADFTPDMAGEYIKFLASKGIANQTARKYITFFRRLWDTVAPKIESPWKTKRPQGQGGKLGKRPFTVEHQRSIIQYIDTYFNTIPKKGNHYLPDDARETAKQEYKALHIIMAYTGLRLVDACQLTIEEVYFDRGVIETMPKKTKSRGENPMYAKIGIHPTLGIVLRTFLRGRSSGFFLPYLAAEYDRDRSSISKRIQKQVAGATGLECSIKPHGRARSVAVYGAHSHRKALSDRMREAGVDIMIRLQVLGHKDSRSEAQDYSHISDKEVVAAMRASMPDLLLREAKQSAS